MMDVTERQPLSRWSLGWRAGTAVIGLAALTLSQFSLSDDYFPFGSLTQYATARDMNGMVRSACLLATTEEDPAPQELAIGARTVGIERGDLEKQLGRIIDDPSMLQPLAESYERLHPDAEPLTSLTLCRSISQLEDGRAVGEPEVIILAEWDVP